MTVVRPAGTGPLVLQATCKDQQAAAVMELYGPHQRSGGALRQLWRKVRLRDRETSPIHTSMRRAVEHRALMAIAIGQLRVANTSTISVAALDRGWTLYAHTPARGTPVSECVESIPVARVWESLRILHDCQISHGDLRSSQITVDDDVLLGGFDNAEYGATDVQLRSDIAQLLVTTTYLYDAPSAVRAAIDAFGKDVVLTASRRLTKSAVPLGTRHSVQDAKAVITAARDEVKAQTRVDEIRTETVTRFTRNQLIQLVLLIALVYVAYPFISSVPTLPHRVADGELVVGAAGPGRVGVDVCRCGGGIVGVRRRLDQPVGPDRRAGGQHVRRDHHPSGCRRAGAEREVSAEGRDHPVARHHRGGVAAVGAGDHPHRVADLLLHRGGRFGQPVPVRAERHRDLPGGRCGAGPDRDVPVGSQAAALAGHRGAAPSAGASRRPHGRSPASPKRLALIMLGCAATTLGDAFALWASIAAFGGNTSFITVTVVTMIGGTLASAAPTPGGVGAVEAALIGGLAAFGMAAAVAVPSVLLYRVLTTWLPVFAGW